MSAAHRLHLGAPREAGSISDNGFFLANPGRDYRLRLATQAEAARFEQQCGHVPRDWFVYTVTKQFFPGMRFRRYCAGRLIGHWTEDSAREIFELLGGGQ
jgi:hypothetical protein